MSNEQKKGPGVRGRGPGKQGSPADLDYISFAKQLAISSLQLAMSEVLRTWIYISFAMCGLLGCCEAFFVVGAEPPVGAPICPFGQFSKTYPFLYRTERYRLRAAALRSPSFVKPQSLRLNKFSSLRACASSAGAASSASRSSLVYAFLNWNRNGGVPGKPMMACPSPRRVISQSSTTLASRIFSTIPRP